MTLSMRARACFSAATGLGPEDTSRFLELHDRYAEAGAKPDEAARAAAADLVAEIRSEAADLTKLLAPTEPKPPGPAGPPTGETTQVDATAEAEHSDTTGAVDDSPAQTAQIALGQPLADGQQDAFTPVRAARPPRARPRRADDGSVRPAGERNPVADDGQAGLGFDSSDGEVPGRAAGGVAERGGAVSALDFRPEPGGLTREGSWHATAARNVDIIELAQRIAAEDRPATLAEQELLSKYVGFGAGEIRNQLFPVPPGYLRAGDPTRLIWPDLVRDQWKPLAERLAALPLDWQKSLLQSTQYAHYTSEGIIRSTWSAMQRLGFTGGKILEPGSGIGSFAMLMPEGVRDTSRYTGIEFDGPTATIARLLSPQQDMLHDDFIKRRLPKDYFDVAIGNPPFSATKVLADPDYEKKGFLLHDFFFAKSLDRVRPGGLLAFVTSHGTMDKLSDKARQYMADRADLMGAVRLPQTAFEDNAGTKVVTDVLFLRKRNEGEAPAGEQWGQAVTIETADGPAVVNEYFASHPEMVLGEQRLSGNRDAQDRRINGLRSDGEYTVITYDSTPAQLDAKFAAAVEKLPANVYSVLASTPEQVKRETAKADFNPSVKREGVVYVDKAGELRRVSSGIGKALAGDVRLSAKDTAWLKSYVGLRDLVNVSRLAQVQEGDWQGAQKALNKAYDAFVKKHGPINAFRTQTRKTLDEDGSEIEYQTRVFTNRRLLREDYDNAIVTALEKIDADGNVVKGPFLTSRTINRPNPPTIKTPGDALAVSLDNIGRLDLADVAQRVGLSKDEVIEALGTAIYQAPNGQWQLADEYLSGNVRDKLHEAEFAARANPALKRNVEALKAVQPDRLGPSQISVKLGASWVDPSYVSEFASEIGAGGVKFDPLTESWQVAGGADRSARKAGAEWGTAARSPSELLEVALNSRTVTIKVKTADKKEITDREATDAANAMVSKIKDKFRSWIWTDSERATSLVDAYNERFNNIAPRRFDGSHLTLPGVSTRYPSIHAHQKRAIWRQIQTGNTYLAHAVGAGKTFEMIAGGMEQKRLGLIKKPIYVVPNHMLEQFANEFMEFYPLANLMVADDENFHTDRRRAFIAAATLNGPDAIIITHSAFERIGVKEETVAPIRDRILGELQDALEEVKADKNERVRRGQLEQQIEAVTQRFDKIVGAGSKDSTVKFEDMGADFVYADEAHTFRKLDFTTNQKIKGIDPTGSKRALDMYVKTRWLDEQRPGRSMVFASGTPVTNTMGELYTIQRFFDQAEMARTGTTTFDGWARQYGEAVSALEPNAAGRYETVTRFAKFENVPELMARIRQFMDVLTSDQLGGVVQRPAMKGGKPNMMMVDKSPDLDQYMKTVLQPRLEESRAWKPSFEQPNNPDPVIAIISDGRFAALDPRFFGANIDEDRTPTKLTAMADRAAAEYHATAENDYGSAKKGGTQIVFYNYGFGETSMRNRGFDARAAFTRRLVKQGVARSDILWFDDANTDAKKEAMFKAMRGGEARVLIGSAKKMGTGVNVQNRLTELQYFDPPWYPADVEQPLGRIIRQGNLNPEAGVNWYATKGTYDSTMWQMVARKQRFIDQAFSGDKSLRTMDDMSEASSYEQAAALASGDPRALQLAGLKQDVERFERLQAAHHNEQVNVRSALRGAEWNLTSYTASLARLEAAFKLVPHDGYMRFEGGTLAGKAFDKAGEFGKALKSAYNRGMGEMVMADEKERALGSIGPVKVSMEMDYDGHGKPTGMGRLFAEIGPERDQILGGSGIGAEQDDVGLTQKVVNFANSIQRKRDNVKSAMASEQADVQRLRKKMGTPFEYSQELAEKYGQLKTLESELEAEGVAAAAAAKAARDAPAAKASIDDTLRTRGVPITSRLDAEKRWNDGETIYAMHEMDEGRVSRVKTIEQLRANAPDQLIALPKGSLDSAPGIGTGYAPASPEHVGYATRMSELMNTQRADGSFVFGRPALFDAIAPGGLELDDHERSMAAVAMAAKRFFGHEAVFVKFRPGVKPLFNGVMSARIPGVIFLNAASKKPLMAVLGHELLHQLRAQSPMTYRDLQARLNEVIQNDTVYRDRLTAAYEREGGNLPSDWLEELHADIVGDNFMDPEFWKGLGAQRPGGLFQRVLQAVLKWLDGVVAKMAGSHAFGTNEFVKDAGEARAAIVEAMGRFNDANTRIADGGIKLSVLDNVADGLRGFDQTAARNLFLDAVTGHGATSFWDRSVGTQYAKAMKNPTTFGRVFNAVQDYIKDTSTFANAAADQAPNILPKLESWRDLKQKTAKKEDLDKAGAALWQGTLTDKKAYNGEELRAMGLTGVQAGLYDEARAAIDQSLDDMVKSELVRLAGRAAEPIAAHAMAAPNAAAAADVLKNYLHQQADDSMDGALDAKVEQMQRLKDEGYAPLMRFGRHTVHVTDSEGKTLYFGMYENRLDANRAARELKADPELKGETFTQGLMSEQAYTLYSGLPLDALELFAETTGNATNPVYQDFLKLTKSNRSVLKRLIQRQGIAGFSEDTRRVLASFVTSNARYASGNLNLGRAKNMAEAIPKELGDLKDEAIKLVDYVQNPKQEAHVIRGLLFANFIGGSVASAAVNLTQPFTMTLPYLSQFGGIANAAGHLLAATRGAASGNVSTEMQTVLDRNVDLVSPQEMHHLQAEVSGGGNPLVQKGLFIWGSLFSLSEQFNRRVTFIAAYNAAMQQHLDNPEAFARQAVIETQGLYNKGNKPNWARGPIGATVMTFKQFSIHYLEFLGRMWHSGPEGKKAVGVAVAVLLATAGAGGLPFADDLDDLIDTIAQALGYDFSSKKAKRKFIAETLGMGEGMAQFATRGISGVSGVPIDVSLRMGMGNLLPATGILLRSDTDRSKDVLELAGAAGSMGKSALDAAKQALQGDFGAAGLTMTPLAIQNIVKAVQMWNTGEYRNQKGQKVLDVGLGDAIAKGIGFQPADVATESAKMGDTVRSINLAKNATQEIAQKWAQALEDHDADGAAAARAELRDWNEKNPESRLHVSMQSVIARVREMRRDRADRTIRSAPIGMRQEVRESLQ